MYTDRSRKYILSFVLLFLLSICAYPLIYLVSQPYNDFIYYVFGFESKLIGSDKGEMLFYGLKFFSLLILALFARLWIDAFGEKKSKGFLFLEKVADAIHSIIRENRNEINALGTSGKATLGLILLIQALFYLYFVCTIPLHYDEWVSYYFFSGKSFWTTMTYYPFPNNHIFYNLVAGVFTQLPLNAEVSLRLPAYISSLLCTYYFFKLCRTYFSKEISFCLVLLIICIHPFVIFSFQARGYGFINLFCVLLMYAATQLSQNYRNSKYRFLLVISLFLGLYSVPSFLYVLLPVCCLLFIYILRQQPKTNILLFVFDGTISLVLTGLVYTLIFCYNDPSLLLNPNGGSTKFSLSNPEALTIINNHIQSTIHYIFSFEVTTGLPFIIVFGGVIWFAVKEKRSSYFLFFLAVLMTCSPLIILPLHKVIPFERTWIYLVFPVVLCLGMCLHAFTTFKFLKPVHRTNIIVPLLICASVAILSWFSSSYRKETPMDCRLAELRQSDLKPLLGNIKRVGSTYVNFEFYTTEMIQYFCFHDNPKRSIKVHPLDSITNEDVLVIDGSQLSKFGTQLGNYDSLTVIDNTHLFLRKK